MKANIMPKQHMPAKNNRLLSMGVSGKVKETVPWPFSVLGCCIADGVSPESIRASRRTQTTPITVAFTKLPIFKLSASMGVMLVGEPAAIAMADGTFTGKGGHLRLWSSKQVL